MTKKELIAAMAEAAGISKAQATEALESYTSCVQVQLQMNQRFVLPNIGSLTVTDRPARAGRNPRTGAKLQIAASKKITFKAAKELKEAV